MTYEMMYYSGIAGTIFFGGISIILFFLFRIYGVLGEVTGITAKRRIEKLQRDGYGERKKKSAIHNNTDKITVRRGKTTVRLGRNNEAATAVLKRKEPETMILKSSGFCFEIEENVVITHSEERIV